MFVCVYIYNIIYIYIYICIYIYIGLGFIYIYIFFTRISSFFLGSVKLRHGALLEWVPTGKF